MSEQITPEPLKAVKVFYTDSPYDLSEFKKATDMRRELFDICTSKIRYNSEYGPEIAEVIFSTQNLSARDQYRLGQVLKKYLNVNVLYWMDVAKSASISEKSIIPSTFNYSTRLQTFEDGTNAYPFQIRFRLDTIDYSIRMAVLKEVSADA